MYLSEAPAAGPEGGGRATPPVTNQCPATKGEVWGYIEYHKQIEGVATYCLLAPPGRVKARVRAGGVQYLAT